MLLQRRLPASIGPERHPGSLGRPAREVWAEIWSVIGPQIEQVMTGGESTWQENALIPITRNGRREQVYWTYSYTPIDDDGAAERGRRGAGGLHRDPDQVLARRQAVEDVERFAQLFQQAPGFVALLRGPDHVWEFANPAYTKLAGREDLVGQTIRAAFPDIEGQGFFELLGPGVPFGRGALDLQRADRFPRDAGRTGPRAVDRLRLPADQGRRRQGRRDLRSGLRRHRPCPG